MLKLVHNFLLYINDMNVNSFLISFREGSAHESCTHSAQHKNTTRKNRRRKNSEKKYLIYLLFHQLILFDYLLSCYDYAVFRVGLVGRYVYDVAVACGGTFPAIQLPVSVRLSARMLYVE